MNVVQKESSILKTIDHLSKMWNIMDEQGNIPMCREMVKALKALRKTVPKLPRTEDGAKKAPRAASHTIAEFVMAVGSFHYLIRDFMRVFPPSELEKPTATLVFMTRKLGDKLYDQLHLAEPPTLAMAGLVHNAVHIMGLSQPQEQSEIPPEDMN